MLFKLKYELLTIPFEAWKSESRNLKGIKSAIFQYCEKWLAINCDKYCNLVNSK